jgi:peptidyl-prolyl cis-trans isomerase A (cyclophilin A)
MICAIAGPRSRRPPGPRSLVKAIWPPLVALLVSGSVGIGCGCRSRSQPIEDAAAPGVAASNQAIDPPDLEVSLHGLSQERIGAQIETDEGTIHCQLERRRTPRAVGLFVGLATGRVQWRDPGTGAVTGRPLYEDLRFFRAIVNGMIQSGCPLNNGTGEPGYRIEVESSEDGSERLSRPGALVLLRYTPAPNRTDPHPPAPGHVIGSQFAILLADMHHLARQVSVIGHCRDLDIVSNIARAVVQDKRQPKLIRVRIDAMGGESGAP